MPSRAVLNSFSILSCLPFSRRTRKRKNEGTKKQGKKNSQRNTIFLFYLLLFTLIFLTIYHSAHNLLILVIVMVWGGRHTRGCETCLPGALQDQSQSLRSYIFSPCHHFVSTEMKIICLLLKPKIQLIKH